MQVILSPAKLLNFLTNEQGIKSTKPLFPERTKELLSVCRALSLREIAEAMKISPKKGCEAYYYFHIHELPSTPRQPASLAYNGIAYKGLGAHDFSDEDFEYAQHHLNIISGLYGVLRPLDEIRPYRFEMKSKIVPSGYKNLYDFWQTSINRYFIDKLNKGNGVIINVASIEYSKVINIDELPKGTRIINIRFLQQDDDGWKQVVVHSKKARGLISRYIIKNRLSDLEEVKGFDYENYLFYPSLSNENTFTFVR